jgi:hypothetical protein
MSLWYSGLFRLFLLLTIIIIAGMRTATPPMAPTITQTARKKSERMFQFEYEIRFLGLTFPSRVERMRRRRSNSNIKRISIGNRRQQHVRLSELKIGKKHQKPVFTETQRTFAKLSYVRPQFSGAKHDFQRCRGLPIFHSHVRCERVVIEFERQIRRQRIEALMHIKASLYNSNMIVNIFE